MRARHRLFGETHRRFQASSRVLAALLSVALVSLAFPGVAQAGKKPDLVATVTTTHTDVVAGFTIEAASTTKNKGTARAPASSLTRFYLSTDAKRNAGDIRLTPAQKVGRLRPGKAATVSIELVVPVATEAGPYRLLACADDKSKIAEKSETNNCKAAANPVTVAEPTTHDLIDLDVAAGEITEEEGLIYKVFAEFSDARLPEEYAGAKPYDMVDGALADAAAEWPALSPATRVVLEPFLIPPYLSGSYWSPEAEPAATPAPARARQFDDVPWRCSIEPSQPDKKLPTDQDWRFLDAAGGKVRIWWQLRYDATDNELAATMASYMDTAYVAVTDVMGREPVSDGGGPCDGTSAALDVALVDAATASTLPNVLCSPPTPVHMLFPRTKPAAWKHEAPYVAHELAHAAQFAYDAKDGCLTDDWIMDSQANWIQDYVTDPAYGIGLPGQNTEQDPRAIGAFFGEPTASLDKKESLHRYGSYVWWFFLARKLGPAGIATVSSTLAKLGGASSIDALDASLSGGIEGVWKDFVRYNLNRAPEDLYKQWDGLSSSAALESDETLKIQKAGYEIELDHLSAVYHRLTFNDKVRTVRFENPFVGQAGVSVQAFVRLADGTTEFQDWTAKDKIEFCRSIAEENVTEIILIVGNARTGPGDVVTGTVKVEGSPDECFCEPASSSISPSARSVQEACGGFVTITISDHWVATGSNGDTRTWDSQGTAQIKVDIKPTDYDPNSFDNRNSTISFDMTSQSDWSPTSGCATSATLTDSYSGPIDVGGWYDPPTDTFNLGAMSVEFMRQESGTTCNGPYAGEYEWFVILPSCPLENYWMYTFPFVGQSGGTRTFSISCSDTEPYPADSGKDGQFTVELNGTITLSSDGATSGP